MKKVILGIETSCDETGAAVVLYDNGKVKLLSNALSSSASIQAKYGGVIPEKAAREQLKSIIPVIKEALSQSQIKTDELSAIAVTYGPGLIGSLLVGVETAKTLSFVWDKPLIPINHLLAHFYANWIGDGITIPQFPSLGLLVSGGHTDIVLFKNQHQYNYLGGTRDDASGECFDKCARLLNLDYPGGPNLSKLATNGDPSRFAFPRPMINSNNFEFSFSGLKTAVANLVLSQKPDKLFKDSVFKADLAASIEEAICDILVEKTVKAVKRFKIDQIMIAGGVAANLRLRKKLKENPFLTHAKLFIPPISLCTDNAVTTATAAIFNDNPINPLKLEANPELTL